MADQNYVMVFLYYILYDYSQLFQERCSVFVVICANEQLLLVLVTVNTPFWYAHGP